MILSRPPLPPGPYLVVGLARSGVAAALALRKTSASARIIACDVADPLEAHANEGRLAAAGVEVHLQCDGKELLASAHRPRALVKSPGVPHTAPVVVAARSGACEVIGELELAWRLLENRFCAVTGTNGKTTTTELIGAMHRAAGAPVAVAGNVGVAVSSLVGETGVDETVVCEASSFQLEDTKEFAPDVAIFLNFSADHLDRHGKLESYLQAKLRLFENQTKEQVALLNAGEGVLRDERIPGEARRIWFGVEGAAATPHRLDDGRPSAYVKDGALWWQDERVIGLDQVRIRGRHNHANALAALAACKSLGLDTEPLAEALGTFSGVEHRLEEVAEVRGVLYVNDSKATNVASALAALRAFSGGVHLILGGTPKSGDFTDLAEGVAERCSACYLIGEAADRLASDLGGSGVAIKRCGDLERAVSEAARVAAPGETVLLAPACASFDQFVNFEDRGRRYRELVMSLKEDER